LPPAATLDAGITLPIDIGLEAAETALLIDLYELTMAASYFQIGLNQPATFTLSVRRMPPRRGFLVAAGIDRLLEAVSEFRFEPPAIDYLESLGLFGTDFLAFLGTLRFTGEVRSVPEGCIFFADEPIVEITAPLIEAQLLETIALNQVATGSLIASKAARLMIAARGRSLFDFGLRRGHGSDAGLIGARASYLAGFIGSSNVLAGRRYGIPLFGTMAHSYVMAHESEREAFAHYTALFPRLSTLLVDTYDTERGVENAARAALELRRQGYKLQAVRLDSGNLADLSIKARAILDRHGLQEVSIFASGNLDEYRIGELLRDGAPIDAFGVGAELMVSSDAPALDAAYKLVEYAGTARIKTAANKLSLPGRKQIFRALNNSGGLYADLIGLADESAATVAREFNTPPAETIALLQKRVSAGRPVGAVPTLAESRERLLESIARLDSRYKDLNQPQTYPVQNTAALNALMVSERMRAERLQA
jgi:nicotinate phosphoribosyltransferase